MVFYGRCGFASAFVMHHHGHHGRKESGLMAFARTLPAERKDMIKQKIAEAAAAK